MKLDRNKMIILKEIPASFDVPTIYQIDSLSFEKGNGICDMSFVEGLAIKTFSPDMISYKTVKWITFCFCGMAIAELTGKYIVPPLDVNLKYWKGVSRLPLLLWEQLWLALEESRAFSQEDKDLFLRLFLPEGSFTNVGDKAYFNNRVGRSLGAVLPMGNGLKKNAEASYERLSSSHKDLIVRLLNHAEIMVQITHAAYFSSKDGTAINTSAKRAIEAV